MQNRILFIISFIIVSVVHVYILQKIDIKNQMTVTPKKKISPVIQLRHVIIKKPEPKKVIHKSIKPKVKKEPVKPKKKKKITKKIIKKRIVKKIKKKILKKKIAKKAVKKVVKKKEKIKEKNNKKKIIKTKKTEPKKIEKVSSKSQVSSPKQKIIRENYLSKVRKIIEQHKKYPRSAKILEQEGMVYVKFTINKNGTIKNVELIKKSKYKRLNRAAIKIFKEIGAFPTIPKELFKKHLSISVSIKYKILN